MIWDERPPSNVEILRALEGLRSQRGLLVQIEALQPRAVPAKTTATADPSFARKMRVLLRSGECLVTSSVFRVVGKLDSLCSRS